MPTFLTTCLVLIGAAVALTGTKSLRPPFVAGLFVGVAATVKITALYALGAFWLFYLAGWRSRWRNWLLLLPAVAVLVLLSFRASMVTYLYFGLPVIGATYLAARTDTEPRAATGLVAFAVGAATPPAVAAFVYLIRGELGTLIEGAIIGPLLTRTAEISQEPPGLVAALLVFGLVFVPLTDAVRRGLSPSPLFAGLGIAGLIALAMNPGGTYLGVLVVLGYASLGALMILIADRSAVTLDITLWIGLAAFSALVGFPFFNLYYVLYSVPFLLAALYLGDRPKGAIQLLGVLASFLLAAVLILGATERVRHGYPTSEPIETVALRIGPADLRVEDDYAYYGPLLEAIGERRGGGLIWGAPDLADLYFFTQTQNPTPNTYEFLSPEPYPRDLAGFLVRSGVCVVALNQGPVSVSKRPSTPQLTRTAEVFPHEVEIGPIELRWRSDEPCGG
jgi:hypothetical protein